VGHEIGRGTIANILQEAGVDPAPDRQKGTTRKEFLRGHWDMLAAADFFSVEMWTALGLVRYHVFFVIRLAIRAQRPAYRIFTFWRYGVMMYNDQVVELLIGSQMSLIPMKSVAIGLLLDPDFAQLPTDPFWLSGSTRCAADDMVMDDIETLMQQAASLGSSGALARKAGEEAAAEGCFREALGLALKAADRSADGGPNSARLEVLKAAALLALDCGEATEARRLMREARTANASVERMEEWAQLFDVTAWLDAWLIAAVRRDPPDVPSLDVLADRYWKPFFGRCQMLTSNRDDAADLAQHAWCRVLRARHTLKPGGNFPAFLMTVATNLWRDSCRLARRAGPLADRRLASLDAALPAEDGESAILADMLPDWNALRAEEHKRLALDIDHALEQLTPLLREVLVSRLLAGDSCAEIGRRHNRTEQTISAWVRQAIREVKRHLEEPDRVGAM
jgi:RNA polymerase sigma-70 factor (ECF subfamily)